MTEPSNRSAEYYLICFALTADFFSIVGFAGLNVSQYVKYIVVTVLLSAGAVASSATLVTAIVRWFSIKGSYYPNSYHLWRLFIGAITLAVTVGLALILITSLDKG